MSVVALLLPDLLPGGDVSDYLDAGHSAQDLLAEVERQRPDMPPPWVAAYEPFSVDKDKVPHRTPKNARLALAKHGVDVRYDEFACRYLIFGLAGFGPALDDAALTRMRLLLEERWNLPYGKDGFHDIVTDHAHRNKLHPVREYLDGLCWDGVERLKTWLSVYAEAEDSDYIRAVGALILIAAVRRVRAPGCKFDEIVVLESGQGTGKSSALAILAVREDWFADDLPLDSDSKVLMERVAGRWLVELAELKGMRRGEVEHVKAMLSRQVDKARLAYGRMTTEQPRQCVFFGTTNDRSYLRDMTGNRRFWPVRVGKFDLEALRRDRDQLWAEAARREAAGASIRLPEHLWPAATQEQAERELDDPFFEILSERLEGLQGKVRTSDLWGLVGLDDKSRRKQDDNVRLNAAMQKLGWQKAKSKLRFDGAPRLAWVKGEPVEGGEYPEVDRNALCAGGAEEAM